MQLTALFFLFFLSVPSPVTIVTPAKTVSVPDPIHAALPSAVSFTTSLAIQNGDTLLTYDTALESSDDAPTDNHPHLAILHERRILCDFDLATRAGVGPVDLRALAISQAPPNTMIAVALSLGVDGAASFFVFVDNAGGRYVVADTLRASRAQIRFHSNFSHDFELWGVVGPGDPDPDKQCTWCLQTYRRVSYQWRSGHLHVLHSSLEPKPLNPSDLAYTPFLSR
jgi:hypothetical protein